MNESVMIKVFDEDGLLVEHRTEPIDDAIETLDRLKKENNTKPEVPQKCHHDIWVVSTVNEIIEYLEAIK
jgi:hypothetical protein